jgi:hypothetical protein
LLKPLDLAFGFAFVFLECSFQLRGLAALAIFGNVERIFFSA